MPDFDFKDKTLGWVGTGRMGYALATRLLTQTLVELRDGRIYQHAAVRDRGARHDYRGLTAEAAEFATIRFERLGEYPDVSNPCQRAVGILVMPADRLRRRAEGSPGPDEAPLVFVEKTAPVGYGELVSLRLGDGTLKRGQVLDTSDEIVVVQVFEGTTGIDRATGLREGAIGDRRKPAEDPERADSEVPQRTGDTDEDHGSR
jgi:hypothetical protein